MANTSKKLAGTVGVPITLEDVFNVLARDIHQKNIEAGWWEELKTVQDFLPPNYRALVESWFLAAKIALIHSEISEMLEGLRKGLMDNHLPHRSMEEVEGADILIRLLDYFGRRNLDVSGATKEKRAYNANRADHTREHRRNAGGKKF